MNILTTQKPRGASVLLVMAAAAIAVIALVMPEQAHAIEFPNIPGIASTDDPITIIAKVGAFIIKLLIFALFATVFLVAAYVLVVTLVKMIKERDTAADLMGRLAASFVVVILSYWFLSEGEKAADALRDVQISAVVIEQRNTV